MLTRCPAQVLHFISQVLFGTGQEDVQPPGPLLRPFSVENDDFAQTEYGRIFRNPTLKPLLVKIRMSLERYTLMGRVAKACHVASTARSIYAGPASGGQFVLSFRGLMRYFSMHQSARKASFIPIFLPSAYVRP